MECMCDTNQLVDSWVAGVSHCFTPFHDHEVKERTQLSKEKQAE